LISRGCDIHSHMTDRKIVHWLKRNKFRHERIIP
jgi:hypothetical protein